MKDRDFRIFLAALCTMMLITALVYIPSLWVPFYLDDFSSIIENPFLINNDYFQYVQMYWRRVVTYSTFVADYLFWRDNPKGYHIWSILLHSACSGILFVLSHKLFSCTHNKRATELAIFTTLLWALLPLNTQAVVYIVQRGVPLATFFALLSTYLWCRAAKSERSVKRRYIQAVTCLLPGVFAKEFVVAMPLIWLALDIVILKTPWRRILEVYMTFIVLFGIAIITAYILCDINILTEIDRLTRENTRETRLEYFFAQQEIVGRYLYKVFWPFPLLLEYPFYQAGHFDSAFPWLSMHIVVITIAFFFIRKVPLFTFGILFYYLAHSVESGFIPITDFAFEHRTYLPNVGLILALVAMFGGLVNRYVDVKLARLAAVSLLILAASVTLYRITQWSDPISFYKRELQFAENNPRLNYQLGAIYARNQNYTSAEPYLKQAFILGWKMQAMEIEYADGLLNFFIETEQLSNAEKLLQQLINSLSDKPDWQSRLLVSYSRMLVNKEQCEAAIPILQKAISLDGDAELAKALLFQCSN